MNHKVAPSSATTSPRIDSARRMAESVYALEDFKRQGSEIDRSVFQLDLLSIVAEGFAEIAEFKDNETGHHIKRVAKLSEVIARGLQQHPVFGLKYRATITESFIDILKVSAPLHDIGKVTIPDHILTKPGRLTPEEFEIMKQHAKLGSQILFNMHRKISCYDIDYFLMAAVIAAQHHEKYDGSGYPRGLRGDEIALEAQITAIVDVFDALMSRRPYKNSFSMEETLGIILESRGTHFGPDLVDTLFLLQDDIKTVYALLKDEV